MEVQDNLPLREATFFILLSLATAPRHGYAIMKDAARLSDGRVTLSTGTLDGAIKRLLEAGWIKRVENGDEEDGSRSRFITIYCAFIRLNLQLNLARRWRMFFLRELRDLPSSLWRELRRRRQKQEQIIVMDSGIEGSGQWQPATVLETAVTVLPFVLSGLLFFYVALDYAGITSGIMSYWGRVRQQFQHGRIKLQCTAVGQRCRVVGRQHLFLQLRKQHFRQIAKAHLWLFCPH